MPRPISISPRDFTSGVVVFFVALPLCLGVALASNAPLQSGLIAGIVGGILVGFLSGSHTSVSGPAAGLTAIVSVQIALLGFPAFLLAVVIAGLIQIGLGIARAGFIAAFFPSSVIKGLLAAIGVILILKQIPHVLGHDADPEGEMAFQQPDQENTFTELIRTISEFHPGAAVIGLLSLIMLFAWDQSKRLKKSIIPAPLLVVLFGIGLNILFEHVGGAWFIEASHLVQVPEAEDLAGFFRMYLVFPDFSQWSNPMVYQAAMTLAAVASLETLLNLEGVDKLDPQQRTSPPSRELLAQGFGNLSAGLLGGIPVTSVIARSSVNIYAGAKSRASAIFHGLLLLISVLMLPTVINLIPLACLAAILLVTGIKLASPKLMKQMWNQGRYQFVPFMTTVVAIVLTDLLIGVLIGLAVAISFILHSNVRRPVRRFVEKHLCGNVLHIQLANQVSFLNRAALSKVFDEVPRGGHLLLDALHTDYIDPDVLGLIRDFKEQTAPIRGIQVSLVGFRKRYLMQDEIQYVDYSTRELQSSITPNQVLQVLKDGHERFRSGQRLTRDLGRQVNATANAQHPLAVVLSCIDSRTPTELIFDVGVGDMFSIRIAGNVMSRKVLGSAEYACVVAGAKLILVMGHTRCGAVTAAVDLICSTSSAADATGCQHLSHIVDDIQELADPIMCQGLQHRSQAEKEAFINDLARRNVSRVVATILKISPSLNRLHQEGRIAVVGAMYDVVTGNIEFLPQVKERPLQSEATVAS